MSRCGEGQTGSAGTVHAGTSHRQRAVRAICCTMLGLHQPAGDVVWGGDQFTASCRNCGSMVYRCAPGHWCVLDNPGPDRHRAGETSSTLHLAADHLQVAISLLDDAGLADPPATATTTLAQSALDCLLRAIANRGAATAAAPPGNCAASPAGAVHHG